MRTADAVFAGSIPSLYETHLVPTLFAPYAQDLAARLKDLEQGTLIEIAAGTGAVTRVLAERLPKAVRIIATDLNEGMLRLGAGLLPSVSWQVADAQQLSFESQSAAAVVCQFGVMFLPDRVAAYREARRVLQPGGRYLFNVWDRLANNVATDILCEAVNREFPQDPPQFAQRTPFGYADVSLIRAELERAGFERIEIETVEKAGSADSALQIAVGLCQGTPLRAEIEQREPQGLERVTAKATAALQSRYGNGAFEHRLSAHVVTAWA